MSISYQRPPLSKTVSPSAFVLAFEKLGGGLSTFSLAMMLAACGGGGGGGGSAVTAPPPPPESDQDEILTIQAGVALYDAVAGFYRLMNLAGMERLTGQAEQRTVPCPGGGSITTNKLATPEPTGVSNEATVFTLNANRCRFMASDGLVYDGLWKAEGNPSFTTYSPSGVCPRDLCGTGRVTVRTSQGRYGYGVATDMTPQLNWDITSTPSSHTINVFFSGSPITNGPPTLAVFGGNQLNTLPTLSTRFTFDVNLNAVDSQRGFIGTVASIRGNRETLEILGPVKATLTFSDTNVQAAVDRDGNGTVDINYTIPWSDFQETD